MRGKGVEAGRGWGRGASCVEGKSLFFDVAIGSSLMSCTFSVREIVLRNDLAHNQEEYKEIKTNHKDQ